VIGLEAGLCAQVKPDPETGKKLVYCCLDEGFIYQKEAAQQEFEAFMSVLQRLETLSAAEATPIFESPYDGSIHKKYGWTNLCGNQIPCDVCSQDHICGNSVVEADEKCDDGPRNSDETPDACRSDCTFPSCGDSVIDRQLGEECDDGNFNGNQPNHCRIDCKLPICGDSIIDSLYGESCDSGDQNSDTEANRCRTVCQAPHCGDGVKDSAEECDDGNRADNDGCSFYCQSEQRQQASSFAPPATWCGNGLLEAGEQCDNGADNANIPNQCRQNCVFPRCGDNIKDAGEECDDGNMANDDGCSAQCTRELALSLTYVCGNQIIDEGEECDAGTGNANIPDHCRFNCRFPICGDGIKDTSEQCDDRNHTDGDGCTMNCFSEFCGDGLREMGEECDDGNLISGDGCSRLCQREVGTSVSPLSMMSGTIVPVNRPPLRPAAGSSVSSIHTTELAQTSSFTAGAPTFNPSNEPSRTLPNTAFVSSSYAVYVDGGTAPTNAANAQVIPFPTENPITGAPTGSALPISSYYFPQQTSVPYGPLNDTGPATLSIVAMGSAAGLAWARRKRRS